VTGANLVAVIDFEDLNFWVVLPQDWVLLILFVSKQDLLSIRHTKSKSLTLHKITNYIPVEITQAYAY